MTMNFQKISKRQRKATVMYTDDNPMTFTTKKKKGEKGTEHSTASTVTASDSSQSPSPRHRSSSSSKRARVSWNGRPSSSSTSASYDMPPPAPVVKRGPGRPPVVKRGPGRPPRSKSLEPPATVSSSSSRSGSLNGNNSNTPNTGRRSLDSSNMDVDTPTPVKRKRGRPPKNIPKEDDHSTAPAAVPKSLKNHVSVMKQETGMDQKHNKSTKHPSIPSKVPQRKRSSSMGSHSSHPHRMRTSSWTPPQEDSEGSFLNHTVTLAPILPPVLKYDNSVVRKNNGTCTTTTTATAAAARGSTGGGVTFEDPRQRQAMKARYPAVFNESGVPKTCTAAVAPFSSQSATSTMTSSSSSSRDRDNQQQQQPQLPTWTPLYTPPVYFEEDYDNETGKLDVDSIIPVTRQITAVTVRKPHHDYLALGDSAGFVLIYSLGKDTINRPVARLESVACQQRARPEQERLRAGLAKKRAKSAGAANKSKGKASSKQKGLALFSSSKHAATGPQYSSSILMDTAETTIHALGMIGDRVVLATSVELECMDIPSGTSLWVCPLSADRFVTSLDMHFSTFNVLVSCSKSVTEPAANAAPVSSLMLLQHSQHNVEICDANSPMLVRSPSCTAIWDVGCDNRLLFVALSANRQELELVLVSGGSIDTWKVACKTKIPIKSTSATNLATSATRLSQSPRGEYTLVASSRGIRLYQTESLQLISVYGDQLALHGQSIIWKDCWLAGSFFTESSGCHKSNKGSSLWLEVDDWLAETAKNDSRNSSKKKGNDDEAGADASSSNLAPYIIGVPHVKGPSELTEKLHVWKVEHASVVPALSIPLPRNAGGALGLAGGGSSMVDVDDRIILVTNNGESHSLLPKMESNFAGIMYPPGYQVITDDIEFIEEEDALDKAVQYDDMDSIHDDSEDEEVNIFNEVEEDDMDEELKEAMRQSLLEHKHQEEAREAMKHDKDVDIVVQEKKDVDFLPCRPEPYLRQFIHVESEDEEEEEELENKMEIDSPEKAAHESGEAAIEDQKPASPPGALFVSHVLGALPNMEKPKPVEDEDCLSFTTTKVVLAVNPVAVVPARPGRGRKSRAGNAETALKASVNPYLQSMMISRQGIPSEGQGSRLEKSETSKTCASSDVKMGDANGQYRSSPEPNPSTNDETAVALGLLGLSPNPSAPTKPTDVLASIMAPKVPGMAHVLDPNNPACTSGSAYLNESSLSSVAAKAGAEAQLSNTMKYGNGNAGTAESLTTSSDKGSFAEESEGDHISRPKPQAFDKTCDACRGRMVVHSCGKRALPIDYDEVAKAERERREKEEEEKKRMRAEKRRLADQRRREAKRQKQRELDEQRLREDEEERLEKERQMRLQEDFASQDLNSNRREQVVASYASYQEQGSLEMNSVNYGQPPPTAPAVQQAPQPERVSGFETISMPPAASAFENVSRPRVGSIFEQASLMMAQNEASGNRAPSAGEAAAGYKTSSATEDAETQQIYAAARSLTPPPSALTTPAAAAQRLHIPAPSASALEALDGLAALASLAGAFTAKPETPAATVSQGSAASSHSYGTALAPSQDATASFSYATTHGFGSNSVSVAASSLEEAKRAIPSFAALRQANGGNDAAPSAPPNGNQQTVETYVWPPRREG
ncbi:MAG: hypothetical protein SGILL_003582 [Bacillariaceae sp.]